MVLRFVKPWKLDLPDRERAKDRRQRKALADEIERLRKLDAVKNRRPPKDDLAQRQAKAFATQPEEAAARGFGEAATEGQFGPFREEDILRIGRQRAGEFQEELTTDPVPLVPRAELAPDTATAQQQAFTLPVGRQAVPDPVAAQRAKDVLRVRDALEEEGMSPEDFRTAVQAGQLRQQGNELASYTLPREQRESYNRVVQKLGVEGTPILAQGLVPETKRHQLESDARDQGIEPDSLFIASNGEWWAQLFAIEQHEISRRTRPKIEKALKIAKIPKAEGIAKIVAEVAVPSSLAPIGRFGQAGRLTRMTARGITEGTLNVMQDKAGRADRGEPAATPIEAGIMFAAGAILGATAPELIGALGRTIRGKFAAKTAQGVPEQKAITDAIAEVTDETGAVRQDILQQLSRDPNLAEEAVRRRAAIVDAELEGRVEFAEPEVPVRAEPEAAVPALPSRVGAVAPTGAASTEVAVPAVPGASVPGPSRAQVPVRAELPEGGLGAVGTPERLASNINQFDRNAQEAKRFVRDNLDPAFLDRYGDAPVMNIKQQFLGGGEPLVEIRTAGWRERAEAIGLEFVRKEGFSTLYRLPPTARVGQAAAAALPEPRTVLPAPARAAEPGAAPAVRQAAPTPPEAPRPATRQEVVAEIRPEGNGASRLADEPPEVVAARERVVVAEQNGQLDTGAKAALDDAQEVARVAEARASDEAVTADMDTLLQRANRICETI